MKFISPESRAPYQGARLSQSQKVRELMIEKERARYIPLMCGHSTDYDTIVLYAHAAPKDKTKEYCETCGKWVKKTPKPKKPEYPDVPLF